MTPEKGYVWFLLDWLEGDWWDVDYYNSQRYASPENVPCTTAELKVFIEQGYFTLSSPFFGDDEQTLEGGGTVKEWKQRYMATLRKEVKLSYFFCSTPLCMIRGARRLDFRGIVSSLSRSKVMIDKSPLFVELTTTYPLK